MLTEKQGCDSKMTPRRIGRALATNELQKKYLPTLVRRVYPNLFIDIGEISRILIVLPKHVFSI